MGYCDRPAVKVKKAETEVIDNEKTVKEIKKENTMVLAGKKAPEFTAPAYHNGEFKEISLSDFKGKWVMLCFYPGDFTFVCGTEVSAVASKYEEFQKLGVEVLSVSVDSQYVHKIWDNDERTKIANRNIPYPMLSDSTGDLGRLYGVYDEESGVDVRGRFLIDPDGIVQAMEVLTPSVGRNVAEAIRQIKAYQYVRESGNTEVTPSGWQPGKSTLKPGVDLVGNVWKTWNVSDLDV